MKTAAIALAVGLAAGSSGAWWVQSLRADAALAKITEQQSKQALAQSQKALLATEIKAAGRLQHATAQQDNTHAYTQTIQALEAGRTADAARIASLQHNLRTTATQRAQAASDAAACRHLADQHQQLAAHAAQGAGVVGELVHLVQQRDTQVNALMGQVQLDRQWLATD